MTTTDDTETDRQDSKSVQIPRIKILFLDVDGVLNCITPYIPSRNPHRLPTTHLHRLRQIVDQTKCKIVLSTSWRLIATAHRALLRQMETVAGLCVCVSHTHCTVVCTECTQSL